MKKILKTLRRKPEVWKFVKFNISVIITTLADVITYAILLYCVFKSLNNVPVTTNKLLLFLGIKYKGYLYSYILSTSFGYTLAYIINRKVTFHSDITPIFSFTLYFILSLCNIFFSTWLGSVAGTFVKYYNISTPVIEILLKIIIINIPMIWSYPIERFIIQRKKVKDENQITCIWPWWNNHW